jgi:hypothetical protein
MKKSRFGKEKFFSLFIEPIVLSKDLHIYPARFRPAKEEVFAIQDGFFDSKVNIVLSSHRKC